MAGGKLRIHVQGVSFREYMSATRMMCLRYYLMLAALLFCVMLIIVSVTKEIPNLFIGIAIGLMVCALGLGEGVCRGVYKGSPYGRMVLEYNMDANGWKTKIGDGESYFTWKQTKRIVRTKHVLLLYPDVKKPCSNVLPRRCLQPGQEEQIMAWHKAGKR